MKKIILAIFLVFFLATMAGAESLPWKIDNSPQFEIHYQGDSELAQKIEATADQHWQHIRTYMPVPEGKPIPIFVYSRRDEFLKAVGGKRDSLIVGIANSQGDVIRVDGTQLFARMDQIIGHELTHVAIFRTLNANVQNLPLWFNEGLAQYEEGLVTANDERIISDALIHNTLIPLSDLSEKFPQNPDRDSLAYVESREAVDFLIQKHGTESIFIILERLQEGKQFETALRDATDLVPSTLESAWTHKEKTTHHWDWIATLYTPIISGIMVLLCLIAWWAMRRKRAKTIRKFEEDDFYDFLNR